METSHCPDCGAQVGGQLHKPLRGFQEFRYALINLFSAN